MNPSVRNDIAEYIWTRLDDDPDLIVEVAIEALEKFGYAITKPKCRFTVVSRPGAAVTLIEVDRD